MPCRPTSPRSRGIDKLYGLIGEEGRIDPSFVITDRASLEDGPALYKKFRDKENGCIKVVMKP
jgi:threonine dehydrogenase-like Zn-dependent dehydrogenase